MRSTIYFLKFVGPGPLRLRFHCNIRGRDIDEGGGVRIISASGRVLSELLQFAGRHRCAAIDRLLYHHVRANEYEHIISTVRV